MASYVYDRLQELEILDRLDSSAQSFVHQVGALRVDDEHDAEVFCGE